MKIKTFPLAFMHAGANFEVSECSRASWLDGYKSMLQSVQIEATQTRLTSNLAAYLMP